VTSPEAVEAAVAEIVKQWGGVYVLVNNAGILRDRMIVNMTEAEWDAVIRVHLRGHFLPLKWAAVYWRERAKAGEAVSASVINTSSTSGLLSNAGQANYGAAKTGIATMTEIANKELTRYGVRVNAICPAARTRLTATVPGAEERNAARAEQAAQSGFDKFDPGNISPFVAYLATAGCPIGGKVFFVYGGEVHLFQPYTLVDKIVTDHRWSIDELAAAADRWGAVEWNQSLGLS